METLRSETQAVIIEGTRRSNIQREIEWITTNGLGFDRSELPPVIDELSLIKRLFRMTEQVWGTSQYNFMGPSRIARYQEQEWEERQRARNSSIGHSNLA